MAGTIKVDSINADSNLALKIANTAVAFIDSSGLRPTSGNVNLDATATSKLYLPSANTVAIQTAGVTAVTVDSSQNVTLAGTLTTTGITNSGVATGARFNPTGSSVTGTGMYLPAANTLGLTTNGTERIRITSDGETQIKSSAGATPTYSFTNDGEGLLFRYNDDSGVRAADIVAIGNTPAGAAMNMRFFTNFTGTDAAAERMRINSVGHVLIATSSDSAWLTVNPNLGVTEGVALGYFYGSGSGDMLFQSMNQGGGSATNAGIKLGMNSVTSRSINARGTVNASGADYAEYMIKCSNFTVAKGDVVGINVNGKLTNVFADAISFVVKSTDPSYVGGDTWSSPEALGLTELRPLDQSASDEVKAQYAQDKAIMDTALETARQLVDRIAFSGQVPVNVTGATAGQYIIPVNDNGSIKGQAVTSPTFEQYKIAVGKVIAIESDGRAKIIVKVA